jgi:hypothetical protein
VKLFLFVDKFMYVPEEEKKIKKKAHGLIIGITVTDG